MIRLLTDLGTDAPYGSSLRISRTVRYHSVGATRQGRPSPGRPGGCFKAFLLQEKYELFLMNDNPVKKILLRELSRSDF